MFGGRASTNVPVRGFQIKAVERGYVLCHSRTPVPVVASGNTQTNPASIDRVFYLALAASPRGPLMRNEPGLTTNSTGKTETKVEATSLGEIPYRRPVRPCQQDNNAGTHPGVLKLETA